LAWQPTFAFRDGLVQMLQSYQKGQGWAIRKQLVASPVKPGV
jgi:hypothetical protein